MRKIIVIGSILINFDLNCQISTEEINLIDNFYFKICSSKSYNDLHTLYPTYFRNYFYKNHTSKDLTIHLAEYDFKSLFFSYLKYNISNQSRTIDIYYRPKYLDLHYMATKKYCKEIGNGFTNKNANFVLLLKSADEDGYTKIIIREIE